MKLFKLINASEFFPRYCPTVINWRHKARGFGGRGKPLTFSDDDRLLIMAGIRKMAEDVSIDVELF